MSIIVNKKRVGLAIAENRKRAKMTQKTLGVATNLSRSYIADIEAGRYMPSLVSMCRIAKTLDMKLNFLTSMTEIQDNQKVESNNS